MDEYYTALKKSNNEIISAKEASIRSTILIDNYQGMRFPVDFIHICKNLQLSFEKFDEKYESKLTGLNGANKRSPSYGLHMIRNIRNYVAHGTFPITENPKYHFSKVDNENVKKILMYASRAAAIYIQTLIYNFSDSFKSDEYIQNTIMDELDELDELNEHRKYFTKNCTFELALRLHKHQSFSFTDPMGLNTLTEYD